MIAFRCLVFAWNKIYSESIMKLHLWVSRLRPRIVAFHLCLGIGLATGITGCGDRTTDVEHFQRAQEYQTQQN